VTPENISLEMLHHAVGELEKSTGPMHATMPHRTLHAAATGTMPNIPD